MIYLGGKTRIAKEILPLILADRKEGQYFVEPFCGGRNVTAKGESRDFISVSVRSIAKQIPKLQDVEFRSGDYKNLQMPEESIIYCGPPYMNTAAYRRSLNHDEFWQWCRERVYDGHKVYISEYQAPEDFVKIWEKPLQNNMSSDKRKATEKLFIYKGQL